jgi:drug/metabolite transporter (DMT)-like permease
VLPRRVLKADLALIGITAIWGSTFVVVKQALTDAPPLLFNASRLTIAAALLALIFARDLRRIGPAMIRAGAVMGFFLGLGYAFQTSGLAYTTPSKSAFITGLSVVIVPFYVAALSRSSARQAGASVSRRLGWNTVAGAFVAVTGLYLLAFAGDSPAITGAFRTTRGDVLTLLCAFAFAGHIVATGEFTARLPFRQLAVLQLAFASLFTWVAAPIVGSMRAHITADLVGALALTAVGATAIAFTVQTWAQQFTPATHAAIVFSLEPVFAWIVSLLWLHERLRGRELLGAALTLAAVFICELAHPAEFAAPSVSPSPTAGQPESDP